VGDERAQTYLRLLAEQQARSSPRSGPDIARSAWDDGGPSVDPRLDELITMLTGAGALPADSPVPGRLAALCERLGVAGHPISAPPAADLPARWAEVMPPGAGPRAEPSGPGPGS
jgi:hypothetical protein